MNLINLPHNIRKQIYNNLNFDDLGNLMELGGIICDEAVTETTRRIKEKNICNMSHTDISTFVRDNFNTWIKHQKGWLKIMRIWFKCSGQRTLHTFMFGPITLSDREPRYRCNCLSKSINITRSVHKSHPIVDTMARAKFFNTEQGKNYYFIKTRIVRPKDKYPKARTIIHEYADPFATFQSKQG